jgi:methionine-rich copper-binding protein CopC
VFDKEGEKVFKKTKSLANDTKIEVELKEHLTSGEYTVNWKCMSLDGHSKKGKYKFTVT